MASSKKPTSIYNLDSDGEDLGIAYKQRLIKEEIIDKDLDKDLFLKFCKEKKIDGHKLHNWNLGKLEEVIKEFTWKMNDRAKQSEAQSQGSFIRSIQTKVEVAKKAMEDHKIKFGFSYPTPVDSRKIACLKLKKTELSDIAVVAKVENPKLEATKNLSFYNINYEVTTSPFKWKVNRREADFKLLREVIVKLHPQAYIPLIRFKSEEGATEFNRNGIMNRMKHVQDFIDFLLSKEIFKACPILVDFLSIEDQLLALRKLTEFNSSIPSFIPFEEMENDSGVIETSYDKDFEFKSFENYFEIQQTLHEQLDKNMSKLNKHMVAASKDLENISKDFEELHSFNKTLSMAGEVRLVYKELRSFFNNWKIILQKQNEVIKTDLKDFFEKMKNESSSFKDLMQRRNAVRERYFSENQKMVTQDQEVNTGEMDKGKIEQTEKNKTADHSLGKLNGKESGVVQRLYDQLGYVNLGVKTEIQNMIKRNRKLYINEIKQFCDDIYPVFSASLQQWTNLVSPLEESHSFSNKLSLNT